MRTKTTSTKIECDGCPTVVVVANNESPPPGWGRGTHQRYEEGGEIHGEPYDLCPLCDATLPWRKP